MYLLTCGPMFKMKCKILYLTMPIVCRKNLTQNVLMDCKIITLEGDEKVFLVESLNLCQCFEIQQELGGWAYTMPSCKNGKVVLLRFRAQALIGSKCHLDFHKKYVLQGGTLRNLLLHRIFSKF